MPVEMARSVRSILAKSANFPTPPFSPYSIPRISPLSLSVPLRDIHLHVEILIYTRAEGFRKIHGAFDPRTGETDGTEEEREEWRFDLTR